jgi:hypothetical protein
MNVKSPNNISEWQMGFNSAFKGLTRISALRLGPVNDAVKPNALEWK